jgi:HlyD family secretion protein
MALVIAVIVAAVAARDVARRAPAPRACETALVTSGHIVGRLRAPGRLMVTDTVRVGPTAPGQVIAVGAAVGDHVAKGQIIARLDEVEQRAAVTGAESQFASAQLLGVRAEKAFAEILRSQRGEDALPELLDRDELLEGEAGNAQLELLHTETEVARREAALALARKLLARRAIRSPLDGIVLERNIEPGESILASPSGPPLFVIGADPAKLRLEVEIDERHVAGVLPGDATFTSPAHGDYSFVATIRQVIPATAAARSPRSYLVVLDVMNDDGLLLPGMSAMVDVPVVAGGNAVTVPNRALSTDGGTKVALVSAGDGRAELIAVGVGVANAELTEVSGPGITAGRVVVADASPSTCQVTPPARPQRR